jgi:hypothetical protein
MIKVKIVRKLNTFGRGVLSNETTNEYSEKEKW